MDNYKESDYAKNKYIVYQTSNGTVEITVTQYLNENPTRDEQDFCYLKHCQTKSFIAKLNKRIQQPKIMSGLILFMKVLNRTFLLPFTGRNPRRREERNRERKFIEELLSPLTELQRKRLILNIVDGLSHHAIARLEDVSQTVVSLSIAKAKRLIRSRFWDWIVNILLIFSKNPQKSFSKRASNSI
jgi:hypothetical protein